MRQLPRQSRSRLSWVGLSLGIILVLSGWDSPQAHGQVVQQPNFGVFSIGSTVLVPDRGGAYLGGITRGADGSVERGVPILGNIPFAGRPFRNRAIGSTRSTSSVSVHVTIIDFEAMDRALLEEAARIRAARENDPRFDRAPKLDADARRRADFIERNLGRSKKD